MIRVRDTCNVWVIPTAAGAVCIDFGSGAVLDRLDELGVSRITDVLVTHHHRDSVQGLARAAAAGARIWVPPVEQELFDRAEELWARRRPDTDYNMRQHRFSLLESVEIAGTVSEYRSRDYGGVELYTLPTPGHTVGSVTYLADIDGQAVAFTGDLLYGAGKVWSLAATQWTYTGPDGLAATILSCGLLARRSADVLLPAHGEPIDDPPVALAETQRRLSELMELRRDGPRWDLDRWLDEPWEELSPHLLRNRTSLATSYALLSDSGPALLVDWGYDLWTGYPLGEERAANRPLLQSLTTLDRDIEAAVTTHYHDDHVAGLNLLREVEGTEVWSPANVAPILEAPSRYDLPCLWFDPVPVDRVLPLGEPIEWHEYTLTVYPLPGHTLYAAAILVEVDGVRVLFTGDQQGPGADRDILNYQYRNRFRSNDYVASAELYAELRPDLLLGGHWSPERVTEQLLAQLIADGRRVAELHAELLPADVDLGAEGFAARMTPYRVTVAAGGTAGLGVEVRNPFDRPEVVRVELVLPERWTCEPRVAELELGPHHEGVVSFAVTVAGRPGRVPIAADVTVGETRFGQQAEALVTVT